MSTRESVASLLLALSVFGCGPRGTEDDGGASHEAKPDSTPAERIAARLAPVSPGHLLDSIDIEELRRQGLRDPIPQLVDSLMAHREIIPHAGVLGGTMGFYSPRSIHVLDDSWIYAEFDDGHVQGRGIFAYSVKPDTSLSFRVVYSVVD